MLAGVRCACTKLAGAQFGSKWLSCRPITLCALALFLAPCSHGPCADLARGYFSRRSVVLNFRLCKSKTRDFGQPSNDTTLIVTRWYSKSKSKTSSRVTGIGHNIYNSKASSSDKTQRSNDTSRDRIKTYCPEMHAHWNSPKWTTNQTRQKILIPNSRVHNGKGGPRTALHMTR